MSVDRVAKVVRVVAIVVVEVVAAVVGRSTRIQVPRYLIKPPSTILDTKDRLMPLAHRPGARRANTVVPTESRPMNGIGHPQFADSN